MDHQGVKLNEELSNVLIAMSLESGLTPNDIVDSMLSFFIFAIDHMQQGNKLFVQEMSAEGKPKLTPIVLRGVNDDQLPEHLTTQSVPGKGDEDEEDLE